VAQGTAADRPPEAPVKGAGRRTTPATDPPPAELPLAAASRRLARAAREARARPAIAPVTGRGKGPRRLRWNMREAIALRLKGYSYEDIARRYGVTKATIYEQLSGVFALLDPQRLEAYESHRTTVLAAVELGMLGLLSDPAKQEKASLNNAAFAFAQIHQARRLEAGQSTANLALHELVERVERERARTRRSGKADELPSAPRQTTDAVER